MGGLRELKISGESIRNNGAISKSAYEIYIGVTLSLWLNTNKYSVWLNAISKVKLHEIKRRIIFKERTILGTYKLMSPELTQG